MSLSVVSSIASTDRSSAPVAETPTPVSTVRAATAVSADSVDGFTQQPLPPRFPWLSRLSAQLEAASHQRAAFSPAPVLGDIVDQSA